MKTFLLAVMILSSLTTIAQAKTDSFKVYGNCGMCKNRIEKAAKTDGVTAAIWDVETKMMTINYDSSIVTTDAIQKKIAAVGHDTDKYTADEKVYKKLPGCCLYDRKKEDKPTDHSGHKH